MWSLKAIKIKDTGDRQEVLACRACLATDVVLYSIYENHLTEDYVDIVGISLQDRYPQQLCCYCAALLQKCAAFRERCRNAYDRLMDISFSGKSMTIKNIQDMQKSHTELKLPYSLSGTEIEEIYNEEVTHDDTVLKTEILHESNDDDFDRSDNDNDVEDVDAKDYGDDIDMTIGDLIDADDDELEIIENKWMKGEYKIENIFEDADTAIEGLRRSGVIDEADLKVFERMPKWHEQHQLTDTDIISLAKTHEFRAVFPDKEEQIKEVEEMKQRRGLVCKLCGMRFLTKLKLSKHSKNLHDATAKFICKICKVRFHYMFRLRYHILQHRVTYQCELCDYKTKNRLDMPTHQSRHKNHRFICEACGRSFLTVGAMGKHIRLWHTKAKPWCDLCGMAFVNQLGLETHVRIAHKDVKVCVCDKCSAEFLSDVALERHRGVGCGMWNCKLCGYVLGSACLLKMHLLLQHHAMSHIKGPLTFDCGECQVSFHSTTGLENHWSTCGKNLHCVQCGENFQDAKTLEEHARRHDASGLTCGECGKLCKTVGLLQQHYHKAHKEKDETHVTRRRKVREGPTKRKAGPIYFKEHKNKVWGIVDGRLVARTPEGRPVRELIQKACMCHVCGKAYVSPGHLKIHLRVHTGEDMLLCDHCPKQFAHKQALKRHTRSHLDKPIKCPQCPVTLKSGLYKHMLTHSKEKRHICQICGKSFKVSTSVKMHIKTVHMKMRLPPRVRSKRGKAEEQSRNVEYEDF